MKVISLMRDWLMRLAAWWRLNPMIGAGILFLAVAVPDNYPIGVAGCGALALGFADRIKRSNGNRPLRLTLDVLGWILMVLGIYLISIRWQPQHLWPFD